MSATHIKLTDELAAYMRAVSLRDTELFVRLREETAALPMGRMQITAEQGQFMGFLVRLLGATRTIEVGVFTGYSSLSVALALPPGGKIIACDVSEEWTSIGRRYWNEAGVEDKIDLRLAPALETLDRLLASGEHGRFDFAFIDADKENYSQYYERILELLRPGGVVAIDNVLWHGDVIDPSKNDPDTLAIRAFNETIYTDERVDLSLVPIGDGLTLARKR